MQLTMLTELFEPIRIGKLTVKNRLMMSAMSINFGVDKNGFVGNQLIQYLVERARGGIGMMLVGGGGIHPSGQELPDLPQLHDDACIPSLKKLVHAVKPYDTRFGVQLMHGGRQSYLPEKVAPSPIPAPAVVTGTVRALETAEIAELVSCFGDSAGRCREAGFDFIELHAAHGYLINQFMSPNCNIRTDEYGGSFENRTRFLFEIIADIQAKTGADFPIGVRINGNDYAPNGWDLEDAVRLAPLLEKAGVAYVHVSAGVYGSTELTIPSMYTPQGCFTHLAEAVKRTVGIPVITVGRIKDPRLANDLIKSGKADMVALGRSVLADPAYAEKARQGKLDQIRPCIACCLGCIHTVLAKEPGSCVVNPDVGREYLLSGEPEPGRTSRVLIAGAGPAGLAAARLFAIRGHQVTVCEKTENAGGLLALGAKAPGRSEIGDILSFFVKELQRLGVTVRYGTELSLALIQELKADKVIVATGALPDMPVIRGLFNSGIALLTGTEVMKGTPVSGGKVLVLGGGMTGLITADYLAEMGKSVAVLNRKKSFAEEMSSNDRYYLRERLKKGGVQLFKQVSIKEIFEDGVAFQSQGVDHRLVGFHSLVISEKFKAIREARQLEKEAGIPFHVIGDAKTPRHLMFAISEAEEIARQ